MLDLGAHVQDHQSCFGVGSRRSVHGCVDAWFVIEAATTCCMYMRLYFGARGEMRCDACPDVA
jgi:hypothetical protein